MAHAKRITGWFVTPSVLKTGAFLVVATILIAYLSQLKARQLAASTFQPIRLEWSQGTSDHRLQDAIRLDDGTLAAALVKTVPKSRIRDNIVERIAYDKRGRVLEAFLSNGWSADGHLKNGTPLLTAVGLGQSRAVEILLRHGANPNVWDLRKRSAALWASAHFGTGPHMLDLLAAHGGKLDGLDSLMPRGSKRRGTFGWIRVRPITLAAMRGNAATILTLVKHGAIPNPVQGEEMPPMIAAAIGDDPRLAIETLLEVGAKPDQAGSAFVGNPPGKYSKVVATALYFSAVLDNPNVVALLLSHGADPMRKSSLGITCLDAAKGDSRALLESRALLQALAHWALI